MKRIFAVAAFFLLILALGRVTQLSGVRRVIEQAVIIPLNWRSQKIIDQPTQLASLRSKVRRLKAENQTLREQLGAIPERTQLWPLTIIRETPSDLYLRFSYSENPLRVGQPVILGEVFLGRITRRGEQLLVAEKPNSSRFQGLGRTERGTEGKVFGRYNEEVVFEVNVNAPLKIGEMVDIVDTGRGWRFLLGTVSSISRDKRLPVKQAVIDYAPLKSELLTVFAAE